MRSPRNLFLNCQAFTLIELMIVIIIIAIMASFAIPNYSGSVERAHRRDGENNLLAIHAANQIQRMETGNFWPAVGAGCQSVTGINNALHLAIIAEGMDYRCQGNGATYTCWACRGDCGGCAASGNPFTLIVTQDPITPGVNPRCTPTPGPCP